jgi:hypothetical protein
MAAKKKKKKKIDFHRKLVLFKYLLSLFDADTIESIHPDIKNPELEEINSEKSKTNFHLTITNRLISLEKIPLAKLEIYDDNIIKHTMHIQDKRKQKIKWKYFQYLSLLFTEIYLDKYFGDAHRLLHEINEFRKSYNEKEIPDEPINEYAIKDLKKLAFWNATGSGKTLLMHVNILQYKHYLKKYGKDKDLNKVILLTPNEGLSKQHLEEFEISNLNAEIFSKDQNMFTTSCKPIEVIEITKLKDEHGDKTVAISAFEGNNLVLVDEGHRGTSGDEWKAKRDQLSEEGFTFEYSATFGQAVRASSKIDLEHEYSKCIIFDYSYKYFYNDGYGKDYRILNLEDDSNEDNRQQYLTACLLSYFQQILIYEENKIDFAEFLLEKPLWVFVGGSVNAVRTQNGRQVSDVIDILFFIADFIKQKDRSLRFIENLIKQRHGFLDAKGLSIFENKFTYLIEKQWSAIELYQQILRTIFNCPTDGATLHIENLKGSDGELGLRVGESDYFGVVNVGDSDKLIKLCEGSGLDTSDKEFSESLFHGINKKGSTINLLIGSKKFTEGWSSWRVSTMGLMNIGRTEGAMIIQLFGRGVRLKGINFSLKRSRSQKIKIAPKNIERVETLNIFGVRADYMKTFRDYLEQEGLPVNDRIIEFTLPVISNLGKIKTPLKYPRIKDGISFRKDGGRVCIENPPEKFFMNPMVINLYSKVQTLEAVKGYSTETVKNEETLKEYHLAFIDIEEIFLELERFKYEKAWYNLSFNKDAIESLLKTSGWYILRIPAPEMRFDDFKKTYRWQEIATVLTKKYLERFYNLKKSEWEADFREMGILDESDPNMVKEYTFYIHESMSDIITLLNGLKDSIEQGDIKDVEFGNFQTISWMNHLYEPLVSFDTTSSELKVSPVQLNKEEALFVSDLKNYYAANKSYFDNKNLYLLRNQGKGRGVGFFEANNFHPDFVMWLIKDDKQYISFIDPKGLNWSTGLNDAKIQFHKTVKDIEQEMNDKAVVFNSFILSNTKFEQLTLRREHISKDEFEKNNVVFQEDNNYIEKILLRVK